MFSLFAFPSPFLICWFIHFNNVVHFTLISILAITYIRTSGCVIFNCLLLIRHFFVHFSSLSSNSVFFRRQEIWNIFLKIRSFVVVFSSYFIFVKKEEKNCVLYISSLSVVCAHYIVCNPWMWFFSFSELKFWRIFVVVVSWKFFIHSWDVGSLSLINGSLFIHGKMVKIVNASKVNIGELLGALNVRNTE